MARVSQEVIATCFENGNKWEPSRAECGDVDSRNVEMEI